MLDLEQIVSRMEYEGTCRSQIDHMCASDGITGCASVRALKRKDCQVLKVHKLGVAKLHVV